MADLTYFQKYPKVDEDESGAKSMRIDHPDFGDVLRTTYSKGVISNFELAKNADGSDKTDPITVKSRVKVRIGGGEESDFIPLFFHPKALYWDDPGTPPSPNAATDFNVTGKYFEKAWMSFRGGDEVAVLMRATEDGGELKPFAVVAFADGVPRIGESVFKVTSNTIPYTFSKIIYAGDNYITYWIWTLIYDINNIYGDYKEHFRYYKQFVDATSSFYYGDNDEEKSGPDGIDLQFKQEIKPVIDDIDIRTFNFSGGPGTWEGPWYCESGITFWVSEYADWTEVHYREYRYTRFLVPLGAILFMIEYIWGRFDNKLDFQINITSTPSPPQHAYCSGSLNPFRRISAAIYTKELYELASKQNSYSAEERFGPDYTLAAHYIEKDSLGFEEIEGFTLQTSRAYVPYVIALPQYGVDWSKMVINVRPHTKEELIAAEMWPKEE